MVRIEWKSNFVKSFSISSSIRSFSFSFFILNVYTFSLPFVVLFLSSTLLQASPFVFFVLLCFLLNFFSTSFFTFFSYFVSSLLVFCFILCLFFLFFLLALASLSTYSIVYLFPCLVCPFVSLLSNRRFFFLSLGFPLFDALLMHVHHAKGKGERKETQQKKAKTFFEFCLNIFAL